MKNYYKREWLYLDDIFEMFGIWVGEYFDDEYCDYDRINPIQAMYVFGLLKQDSDVPTEFAIENGWAMRGEKEGYAASWNAEKVMTILGRCFKQVEEDRFWINHVRQIIDEAEQRSWRNRSALLKGRYTQMPRRMADKIRGIPEWEWYLSEECKDDESIAISKLANSKNLMREHEKCLKKHFPNLWDRVEKLALLA